MLTVCTKLIEQKNTPYSGSVLVYSMYCCQVSTYLFETGTSCIQKYSRIIENHKSPNEAIGWVKQNVIFKDAQLW